MLPYLRWVLFLFCCVQLQASSPPSHFYSLPDCDGIPLDKKLIEILQKKEGIFIEVGANDGISQSNTKILEEVLSWKGILIEPSSRLYEQLCRNRPGSKCIQCALGSFKEDRTWMMGDFDGNLMSSAQGNRLGRTPTEVVMVRSLQSILDEQGLQHVDFFSLDTEGYEFNILQGIDFDKTTFDYLLIEIYSYEYEKIVSFLQSKGYFLHSNFSNYHLETNPHWDGTHNDYLFYRGF